jgi:tRNA A-37 threonylcarbamoyl transferase component Bud32
VLSPNSFEFIGEFRKLCNANNVGAPVVVVDPDSYKLVSEGGGGGGYLMKEVGTQFGVISERTCIQAFLALHALHANSLCHGDARLPNLLFFKDGLKWIDMRSSVSVTSESNDFAPLALIDAASLARSILSLPTNDDMTPLVDSAIIVYADSRTNNNAQALAKQVFAAKGWHC